jgi:hypothetical protein
MLAVALATLIVFVRWGRAIWHPVYTHLRGQRTVAEAAGEIGSADARIRNLFAAADLAYPPERIALLVFKEERTLELWAEDGGRRVHIHTYPITAASGHAGPKLREGDCQVPEGIYRITGLNPNSAFHLSMKLDYPNAYDRRKAREEGRTDLGGDIFIHGGAGSIGCIAVGDSAIEELFLLVKTVGIANVEVLIAPNDLRGGRDAVVDTSSPSWASEIYDMLRREMKPYSAAGRG